MTKICEMTIIDTDNLVIPADVSGSSCKKDISLALLTENKCTRNVHPSWHRKTVDRQCDKYVLSNNFNHIYYINNFTLGD